MGAAVLVWAPLPLVSVGGAAGPIATFPPWKTNWGDPKVPWHKRDERREAEPTTPVGATPAPKTFQE